MKAPHARLTLGILVALQLAAVPSAHALWPQDPYAGRVLICGAGNEQYGPAAISDGAGGSITVWYDVRNGVHYDIYAQRTNAAGQTVWTANGVAVCTTTGFQANPVIAPDGSGGAIIAWPDARAGNYDIYTQRLNANGVPQWTADGVALCTATGDQLDVEIVSDGTGGAVMAWEDLRAGNLDIYARRINSAGVPQWAANGVAVCTATGTQRNPVISTDGAGGAIVAWPDFRAGNYDIYSQRITSAGSLVWAANGLDICVTTGTQDNPTITSDGSSGAVIAWEDLRNGTDHDVYAQRVNGAGAELWFPGGTAVSTLAGSNQSGPVAVSDGSGGAIVVWRDARTDLNSDVYAQRISANSTVLWSTNGVALTTITGGQFDLTVAADGAGGAIVAWADNRSSFAYDIYAQRISALGANLWASGGAPILAAAYSQQAAKIVSDGSGGAIIACEDNRTLSMDISVQRIERYGQIGNPEPFITGVKDVKNDQGGWLKVSWNASYLDVDPVYGILDYRLWRSVPSALAQMHALSRGFSSDPEEAAALKRYLILPSASQYAWEPIGTVAAGLLPSYSFVAPTTADSVPGSFPRTVFMVEARAGTAVSSDRWYSEPDSGYSVDNLPPTAPAPLTGQYFAGTTHLHWNPNHEADLAGYRLYRGSSVGFTPGPVNLVAALADTGYADPAGVPFIYKLTAIDAHGNESAVATLIPTGTLDASGTPALHAFLELAGANPSRAASALRFGLPAAGRVHLAVHDAAGRQVRTLAEGEFPAGQHSAAWDGNDDAGHPVAAGLYFARIDTPGFTATRRIARLR